MECARLGK